MYIEKFEKNGKVYCGFFSNLNEYPSKQDIPYFLKNGDMTKEDLAAAEAQQQT